jgi:hypothetical protein
MEEGFPCRKWKENGVLHIFMYIQKHNLLLGDRRRRRRRWRRRRRRTRSRTRKRKKTPLTRTLPSILTIWDLGFHFSLNLEPQLLSNRRQLILTPL